MPNETVLVTGASGFIARQILQPLLDLGYEVHGVSHRPDTDRGLSVHWHSCNLLNALDTEDLLARVRPSHLLHAAWYVEHRKFWMAQENNAWLEASTYLFKRFIAQGGKRIVGIGTCAEYDWKRSDSKLWKETDACHPHTLYGQTKLKLQERLSRLPVSYAWARLFNVFGLFENPQRLVPYVIQSALNREPALCSAGTQIRDFIDTTRCGRALAQTLDSDVSGIINIGGGEAPHLSIADIVKHLCSECGHPDAPKFGALPMNMSEPAFMIPDISRLQHEVKFVERYNTLQTLSNLVAETVSIRNNEVRATYNSRQIG
jgi:nucleoside-diphosphate-sugar epimerase